MHISNVAIHAIIILLYLCALVDAICMEQKLFKMSHRRTNIISSQNDKLYTQKHVEI